MSDRQRLLIVEDEAAIRTGLCDVFVYHGFEVESAADGNDGLAMARAGRFDLILLDVMMPGMDGFSVCNAIREDDPAQPIILLTAKSADEDIIQGLTLGADDYVTKPFSVAELVLRVQAVLRRSHPPSESAPRLTIGDIVIDRANRSAEHKREMLKFTARELEILDYLAQHHERPVSREELLHKVWGYARDTTIETRTVDIHIAKLRRKLEPDPANPRYLVTLRGAGYRLVQT